MHHATSDTRRHDACLGVGRQRWWRARCVVANFAASWSKRPSAVELMRRLYSSLPIGALQGGLPISPGADVANPGAALPASASPGWAHSWHSRQSGLRMPRADVHMTTSALPLDG